MRILIADDDDYTREGLIESVEWEQYGINNILEARDGEEALRLAARYKPDIVLTDIRMPRLNGIVFAEKLGEYCPDCKLLFMSGYLDVDYLKSAIKLSAVDYIEKPIKIADLEEAIQKTVQSVQKSQKLEIDLSIKKILQHQKLARLLTESTVDSESILKLCEEEDFPMNTNYVCLMIFSPTYIENGKELLENTNNFWKDQAVYSVGDYLGEGRFIFVLSLNRVKMERIESLSKQLFKFNENIYVGIGEKVASISEIKQSYRTVQKALERSFYHPEFHYFQYSKPQNAQSGISPQLFIDFYKLLKSQPGQLADWIDSVCNVFVEKEHPPREQVCALFSSIGRAMIQEKGTLLAKLESIYDVNDIDQRISELHTILEIKQFIQEICKAYCLEVESEAKYSRTVIGVMDYISSHVSQMDLDLPEIGQQMHLSCSHLNMLFKQETGTTITQYIRDYRIELAKKLITNEHYKMNAISELCGFASPSYFAKVFRTCTNLTPIEYRKMRL
ncbi:response regulator [Paenibacillus monticola]|uniref:Response regulator n=1 Tax=Paenibacillus monticola TaxID=2666075 RepID=A0A7X2H7T3_9BACL|nr:response regulator [Paenibacillus monticola]MRN55035.1 response regulator [Paenibacillus monticola]